MRANGPSEFEYRFVTFVRECARCLPSSFGTNEVHWDPLHLLPFPEEIASLCLWTDFINMEHDVFAKRVYRSQFWKQLRKRNAKDSSQIQLHSELSKRVLKERVGKDSSQRQFQKLSSHAHTLLTKRVLKDNPQG